MPVCREMSSPVDVEVIHHPAGADGTLNVRLTLNVSVDMVRHVREEGENQPGWVDSVCVAFPAALVAALEDYRRRMSGPPPHFAFGTSRAGGDPLPVIAAGGSIDSAWEAYRCDQADAGRVCGIRARGDGRPWEQERCHVVRDTNLEECTHDALDPATAERVVSLHNADLARRRAVLSAPIVNGGADPEFIGPSMDQLVIDAAARVVNDVVHAAGVVGSPWAAASWDDAPEWSRAAVRMLVSQVLGGRGGAVGDPSAPPAGALVTAAARAVVRALDDIEAASRVPVLKVNGNISDEEMRRFTSEWKKAAAYARPRPILVDSAPDHAAMRRDVLELLWRARAYDDKPHRMYSHIAAMAERHADGRSSLAAEVRRVMDAAYSRAGGHGRPPAIADQPPPRGVPHRAPVWSLVVAEVEGSAGPWPATLMDTAVVIPLVAADMRARDRVGRDRYGVPLTAGNGRDQLVDLYQELLDAAAYCRAAMEEGLPDLNLGRLYWSILGSVVEVRDAIEHRKLVTGGPS